MKMQRERRNEQTHNDNVSIISAFWREAIEVIPGRISRGVDD
jgi:hypothetical protein